MTFKLFDYKISDVLVGAGAGSRGGGGSKEDKIFITTKDGDVVQIYANHLNDWNANKFNE